MPKRSRPKSQAEFRVVQQSYTDKDYEDNPKPVLVPTAYLDRRRRAPVAKFGEDLPEDFEDKRNMLVLDDAKEDRIFEDEVEEDFDQDFIREMMYGDGEAAEGADAVAPKKIDEDDYPKHQEKGAIEKQFEKMMNEFEIDEGLDEEDPRAQGPLEVSDYNAALEQFVRENADLSQLDELPVKHRGLINQLRRMADETRIFDSNKAGEFHMVLDGKKHQRRFNEFQENAEALREQTLTQLRQGELQPTEAKDADSAPIVDAPSRYAEGDALVPVVVKQREQHDCETILTTHSTLFNHPNVIAAAKKKIKLVSKPRPKHHEETESEEEVEEEEEDTSTPLNVRPKNETAEEKKERRKAVKEAQRQARLAKKALKGAYKGVNDSQIAAAPKAKEQKSQMVLSLVKGEKRR